MRKLIVLSFITLDGVLQAPGGPDEDKEGGFKYGGWMAPYGDKVFNKFMKKDMEPADLLLGRKTFDIWEEYWPKHASVWPGINEVTKNVMSRTRKKSEWENSVFIKSIADIKKLKNSKGSDIKVWGSGNLIQALLKNDLVDELRLKIFPLTLGKGKKLFDNGVIPAAFKLVDGAITPSGIIVANYKRPERYREREIITGTIGE